MYMRLKDGKTKVLTLSYDDGVVQDIRLMKILDKFGIKCTFNINTGKYLPEGTVREKYYGRMTLSESQELFVGSGHEVAVHCVNHPYVDRIESAELVAEVIDDRRNIEAQYGTIARGMAYPFGVYNDEVVDVIEKCGICYSRTVESTERFSFPENWLTLHPTCHHNNSRLMELAKTFAEKQSNGVICDMFYLWGHSYEFDNLDNWNVIEEFAEYIGNRDDIWYATNIEVYDYVKAYESLQTSVDKKIIHNPTCIDVWVLVDGEVICIPAGETVRR